MIIATIEENLIHLNNGIHFYFFSHICATILHIQVKNNIVYAT